MTFTARFEFFQGAKKFDVFIFKIQNMCYILSWSLETSKRGSNGPQKKSKG